MTGIEAGLLLFFDQLVDALILPPIEPYVLKTMILFHTLSLVHMILLASLGAITGMTLNYGLGRMLISLGEFEKLDLHQGKLQKLRKFMYRYGWVLLTFSFVPMVGPLAVMLGGFTQMRFFFSFLCISFGQVVWILWQCL